MKIIVGCFSLLLLILCFFCSNTYATESKGVTVISSSIEKSPGVQGGVISVFAKSQTNTSESKGYTIISSSIEKSPGVQGGVIDMPVKPEPTAADARAYAPRKNAYVNDLVTLQSSHYCTITNNTQETQSYSIVMKLQKDDGKYVDYKETVQVEPNRSYNGQKDLYMNGVIYTQAGTYNVYAYTDVTGESSSHAKDVGYVSVQNNPLSLIRGK